MPAIGINTKLSMGNDGKHWTLIGEVSLVSMAIEVDQSATQPRPDSLGEAQLSVLLAAPASGAAPPNQLLASSTRRLPADAR